MIIPSTAYTAQARRTPQRSQEKRSPKEQPKAQIQIESEPVPSTKDPGWHYFWGKHLNTKRKDWAILCREDQASWVIQQQQDNLQLIEGLHFADTRIKTEDGYATRSILSDEFYLDEPEPEEEPMSWSHSGQEIPVVVQPPQALIDVQTDAIAVETLRRFNRFRCCCTAAGLKPTPSELITAMQANHSSVCIDASKGINLMQRNS
jgi:hypothetical protein